MLCKHGLCHLAVSVYPFVCVSVTFVHSVITNKDIFEFFSPPGSQAILVFFLTKRHGNIPTETSLTGASNAGGVGRNRDYEPISGFTALQVRRRRIDNTWPAATGQVLSIRRHRTTVRPQVVTLIAGSKRRCWQHERRSNVYDKKPQRYAKDNRTAHLIGHAVINL